MTAGDRGAVSHVSRNPGTSSASTQPPPVELPTSLREDFTIMEKIIMISGQAFWLTLIIETAHFYDICVGTQFHVYLPCVFRHMLSIESK